MRTTGEGRGGICITIVIVVIGLSMRTTGEGRDMHHYSNCGYRIIGGFSLMQLLSHRCGHINTIGNMSYPLQS